MFSYNTVHKNPLPHANAIFSDANYEILFLKIPNITFTMKHKEEIDYSAFETLIIKLFSYTKQSEAAKFSR